jgi:hypothetical protein
MTWDRSDRLLTTSPFVLLASFGLFWFADTIADPDLWGHIRFGQDIVRTGVIIQRDPYSYRTGGQPWINHEWLSEVIFGGLYNQTGSTGLIAFKVFVSLLILWLSHAHLRRHGMGPFSTMLLLLLISVPFRMGLGTIRPQIFTYLFFLIQLLILAKGSMEREYWLWVLPILLAGWVNLHGGVLAGIGALGLWIAVRIVLRLKDDATPPIKRLTAVGQLGLIATACGLAVLLNPYGSELVRFLWRTATVPRPEIIEWAPIGLMSLPGRLYLGLVAIGVVGLIGSRRRRAPEVVLIFCVATVLPLVSERHYPLFALALIVLTGEHIADVWNRCRRPTWLHFGQSYWIAAGSLLFSLILIGLSPTRFGCIRIEPFYFAFPARGVEYLKRTGFRGNMAVPFDWGEYVLWHLGPGVKVSIDGRRETAYSTESYQQSLDFARGTGRWDALLKTTTTDLVLTQNGSPTANLMSHTGGWVPLYQDTFCVLFIREGLTDFGEIMQTPVPALPDDGNGLCFPAPRGADSASAESEIRLPFVSASSR